MALPETIEGIRAQGWKYQNTTLCKCGINFDWFKRWSSEKNKFEFMPVEYHEATAKFVNHFATCTKRDEFRKKKQNPDGFSKRQLQQQKKREKEAELEARKGPKLF